MISTCYLAVADPLRVVQRVADHPDRDPVAVLLPVVGVLVDPGQVRAVGQGAGRSQDQPLGHPRQHLHPARAASATARS